MHGIFYAFYAVIFLHNKIIRSSATTKLTQHCYIWHQ